MRMGTEVPKQFLLLGGRPVLMYTLAAFRIAYPEIPIVLVLPDGQQDAWRELCEKHQFDEPHTVVTGGDKRFESVRNGLATLKGEGFVAVHDGVRPLITPNTIRFLFEEAEIHSNAIPTVKPKDSVRWEQDGHNHVVDRNFVKLIQTPQVFELNKLKKAYVQEYDESFTDDATVWERAGNTVYLTDGQVDNLKITGPEDLKIAEAILEGRGQRAKGRN